MPPTGGPTTYVQGGTSNQQPLPPPLHRPAHPPDLACLQVRGGTSNCFYSGNFLLRNGQLAALVLTVDASPAWHYYIRAPGAPTVVVWSDIIQAPGRWFYCNVDYRGQGCNASCTDPLYCYY